jgi:hypothetical protein
MRALCARPCRREAASSTGGGAQKFIMHDENRSARSEQTVLNNM